MTFSSSLSAQTLPAFPGAEGYGAYATGGRGGDVYHVTNLNSSGAGSFFDAIATVPAAGRTIVFDVSGYIRLPSGSSGTRLTSSKVTIAGQTAPGDGIGFYNNFFRISGDDVIIRHLRFRHGKYGSGGDCIDLDSGCQNAILDHVSMQFSTDENMSSYGSPPENLTLQYSLNAWGLETHSCGGLWDQNHATSHHNLWAHNHTRNPKARPNGLLEWVNNVTFDWDIGFIMGDSESNQNWKSNVINNYFICPPGNTQSKALVKGTVATNGKPNFTVFLNGNLTDNDGDGVLNGVDKGYSIVEGTVYSSTQTGTSGTYGYYQASSAISGSTAGVATDSPLLAYKKIVSNAGALRLDATYSGAIRDEVDTILFNKLTSQTAFHVTRESATGASNSGFGTLNSTLPLADTDRDGIPDLYEGAVGMNSGTDDHNTAFTSSAITSGSTFFPTTTPVGYTYLEEYLHFMASPHAYVAKNTSSAASYIDIDLARYTSGFTKSTVSFTISNIVGGTLTTLNGSNVVQGDGHTVRFTPTLNASGRARFDFTVTDGDGVSWTQRFCLVTTASGIPKNLRWKGDGTSNAWDTTTSNWLKDTAAATFDVSDTVTFDDTGSNAPAVNVASAISPGAITVNASKNYTISGAGAINGTGGLIKSGTGTLTVGVTVGTSGSTQLSGGGIVLNSPGNLGSGTLTVSDSVSLSSAYSDSLTLGLNSNIVVPSTATLALGLSKRMEVNGSLTGAGTVNLTTSSNLGTEGRAYWDAPSASFTGALNISGGGSGRLALRLLGGSFDNFTSTKLNLSGVSIYNSNYSGGSTIKIGSLTGDSTSSLKGAYNSGGGTTTWQVGGLNLDNTFAGSILDGTSATKLIKEGTGSLTLSGSNSFTGTTTLSAGKLIVNGTLGNTAVSTASGTTLAGTGSIGSSTGGTVTIATGGILSPGSTAGAAGTLTLGNGLTFGDISLPFDLSSNPSGTNNDKIVLNGGTMTVNGVPTFTFNYLDGVLGNGTYTLISGGSETSAPTSAQPASNLPTGTRQTFSLTRSGSGSGQCYIQLTVSGTAPASLTWTGANGGIWDSQTTSAWSGGPTATFFNFDAVTFNDTSSSGSVNINSSVAPRSLTVNNNTLGYNFSGTGAITGTTSLTKSGTGSLTISNANTYSGGTVINAGTIILANDAANTSGLGTGTITFNSGTLTMYDNSSSYNSQTYYLSVPAGKTGAFNTDSRSDLYGTLNGSGTFNVRLPWIRTALFADWSAFTGQLNFTTDSDGGDLRLATSYSYPGFPNASVNLADKVNVYFIGTVSQSGTTIPFGALSGGSLSTLKGGASASGGRPLTYRIGSKGTDATFAGTISEQDSTVTSTSIVKTGSGSWTLSGNSTWNGSTTVEAGTLIISGSVSSSTVSIQSGAQLTLSNGSVTADAVNVSGNATLSGSGNIVGDLNNDGTITSSSGTLNVTGSVVNNGTMRFTNGSGITTNGVNTFVNNGLLDLLTGLQSLPANFENNGTVLDSKDLRVASVSKNGSNFSLTILGYTGHNYQLQRNTSLTGGTWVNVGSAQAGNEGAPLSFSDSSASGAKGFYRLQVTP